MRQDGDDIVIESRSHAQMVVEQADNAGPSRPLPGSLDGEESWKYLLPIAGVVVLMVLGTTFFS